MKKLFTLFTLLVGVVMAANAVTYGLYVGGVLVTSDNASNITGSTISGKVSFNPSTKTLTLDNATIKNTSSNSNGISNNSIKDLIIKTIGPCTIEGENGIRASKSTMIQGTDFNFVYIKGTKDAIWIDESDVTVQLQHCWVTLSATEHAVFSTNDNTTLYLSECDVTLTQTNTSNSCVTGVSKIETNSVTIDWNGNKYDTTKKALVDSSGNNVANTNFKGRLAVGRYIFYVNGSSNILLTSSTGGACIKSGSVTYNPTKKELKLNNVIIDAGTYCGIRNYAISNLKVFAEQNSKISSTNSGCIFTTQDMTIEGNSRTQSSLTLTNTVSGNHGIYMFKLQPKLTVDKVGLIINSNASGINGYSGAQLAVNESKLNITSTNEYAIKAFSACQLTKCCVNTNETPVFFNAAKKGFTDISQTLAKKAVIDVPTESYDISICGIALNNLNAGNFLVEGLKAGTISYTNTGSESGTLKLTNVNLNYAETNQAVIRPGSYGSSNHTITISGSNTLKGGHSSIYPAGSLTINGAGNLTCDATGTTFAALYHGGGNGTVTIDVAGTVKFTGGKYGYYSMYSTSRNNKLVLKNNSSGYSDYTFQGTSGAIIDLYGGLTLENMDFYSDPNYGGFPGCYWDEESHRCEVNGGSAALGVNFYKPAESYGIKVGGVEVNSNNCSGVGSKYITAGGGTAVTYNNSSKILTLNGATINYGTSSVNGIKNESVDGLTIKLVGDNNILNEHSGYSWSNVPIRIDANTTITGDNLTINKLPISTYSNAKLTFLNAKKISLAGMKANTDTSNSELEVNNSNVTVNDNIFFFKNVSWPNSKLLEPLNGYYTKSDRFYTSAGASATKVVFGDKNATAIDGIEADTNAEVTGIYDVQGRKHNELQPGVNIVRMSDGTTRKIIK